MKICKCLVLLYDGRQSKGKLYLYLSYKLFLKKCNIHHFQVSHNAPICPEKKLHNLCFSFLMDMTAVPREIENSAYAKFWGRK